LEYDYAFWSVVVINSLVFIVFALSFARPRTSREWRTLGAFSAFIVALFTEMYGFPLTIYLLSGWLARRYPHLDLYSHDAGHLWYTILHLKGDPHNNPVHLVSNLLVLMGLIILAAAWKTLHKAQRNHEVAATGLYALVRHPQYLAFIMIMVGFLVQWPTILTVAMFPVLVAMYVRLARHEEREAVERFGEKYTAYAALTPAFIPWPRRLRRNAGKALDQTSGRG